MEEPLAQEARDEVEVNRHRIMNIRHEIPILKQRCEGRARALDSQPVSNFFTTVLAQSLTLFLHSNSQHV